ncbi:MAG: hypothetical protein LBL94_04410 [Prevotellaceae bacterium]|jgi:hypothetical protein|nr:hypothetical protein [Prevotellaceae bacterium]
MMRSVGDLDKASLNAMTVYAHYTGADDFAYILTTTPNFMFAQLVEKTGSAWTYSPLNPAGSGTMTGNAGNGYARITIKN